MRSRSVVESIAVVRPDGRGNLDFARRRSDSFGCVRICSDLFGLIRICSNKSEKVRTNPNRSVQIQTDPNESERFQTNPEALPQSGEAGNEVVLPQWAEAGIAQDLRSANTLGEFCTYLKSVKISTDFENVKTK